MDLLKTKKEKRIAKPIDMTKTTTDQEKSISTKQQDWMVDLIKQKVAKVLKETQFNKEGSNNVNFIHTTDMQV